MPCTRLTGFLSALAIIGLYKIRFFKQEALTVTRCNITGYLKFVYKLVQSYANISLIQKRMFKFWGAKLNVGVVQKSVFTVYYMKETNNHMLFGLFLLFMYCTSRFGKRKLSADKDYETSEMNPASPCSMILLLFSRNLRGHAVNHRCFSLLKPKNFFSFHKQTNKP
jgi:hypothetical protein